MLSQDYEEFFDALEHEELYECLGLDIPEQEEVEYSKKYKPEEKVSSKLVAVVMSTTERDGT